MVFWVEQVNSNGADVSIKSFFKSNYFSWAHAYKTNLINDYKRISIKIFL